MKWLIPIKHKNQQGLKTVKPGKKKHPARSRSTYLSRVKLARNCLNEEIVFRMFFLKIQPNTSSNRMATTFIKYFGKLGTLSDNKGT